MAEPNHSETRKADNSLIWVKINLAHFRSMPGMVKLVQLLLGIICMACASPPIISATHWFLFVVVMSFIATLVWVFMYLLSIKEALTLPINWILTELFNISILTILYGIAAIVQLSTWPSYHPDTYRRAPNIAAGVFGIFNTMAYGLAVHLLFKEWKTNQANN